jgi:hypothetical protein
VIPSGLLMRKINWEVFSRKGDSTPQKVHAQHQNVASFSAQKALKILIFII